MGLIDTARGYYAAWKFKRTDLGQALTHHVHEFFYSGQVLSWLEQENKDKFVQDFYGRLIACQQDADPAMAVRTALVEYTLLYSQLLILALKPEEKELQHYAENPYITGEISSHVEAAAEHVEEAKQFMWQNDGATAEELVSFANTRSSIMLFYANGFNMARIAIGDTDPAKDWFRPFVEAQVVWEEDTMREKLGLPRLVPGTLHGLPYSSMMNYILNGERNPFFKFRQDFPDRYLGGEGPLPEAS